MVGEPAPDARAVTPPRREPRRPVVVTVAVVLWTVLGVLVVGIGVLYLVGAISSAPGATGLLLPLAATLVLAAAGAALIVAARRLAGGSRSARRALSITGGVLAAVGLVQLTFLGVAGSWFVAFLAGVVLLHVPTARAWFAGEGP